MVKDDLECECMNELFGRDEMLTAQIYVKSDGENTAILVARGSNIYYQDVIDVPEITGIQRGVSFVKHNLDCDITEIYPDKLDINEVLKDTYINYCKVHACEGKHPSDKMKTACYSALAIKQRWNIIRATANNGTTL